MINSRNINDLVIPTRERVNEFIRRAKSSGIELLVTSTYRDEEAQNALYAQGRTKQGDIVTNARGGESYHNFRCAVDVVPIKYGKCVWKTTGPYKELWRKIGIIGESCGLEWAGRWQGKMKEMAHFQYTGGLNLSDLRSGKIIT